MEKQQTAVDFLRIAIESKLGMRLTPSYYELFSIAKEMEEKQIMNAFEDGQSELSLKDKEEYYNEIFKK